MRSISPIGRSHIKRFAILNYQPSRDEYGWKIGYECRDTKLSARGTGLPGLTIYIDTQCTERQAEQWFDERCALAAYYVNNCVHIELTQNQFDAIASYVYFMPDMRAFLECEVAKRLNSRDLDEAELALFMGIIDKHKHMALMRRRLAEVKLFCGVE